MAKAARGRKPGPKAGVPRKSKNQNSNDEALKLDIVKFMGYGNDVSQNEKNWSAAYNFVKGISTPTEGLPRGFVGFNTPVSDPVPGYEVTVASTVTLDGAEAAPEEKHKSRFSEVTL